MQSDDSRRLSEGEFLKILSTPQYSDVVKKVCNKSVTVGTEDNQPSMWVAVILLIQSNSDLYEKCITVAFLGY